MRYSSWIFPRIGLQSLLLDDLLRGPGQSVIAASQVCMRVYVCVCAHLSMPGVSAEAHVSVHTRACTPRMFRTATSNSGPGGLRGLPAPPLRGGTPGALGSERGGRLPAGPGEELCLGWCVGTGSLACESPAKLTQVSFGEKCNQLLHSVPF